jgi:hypothetical protein
VADKIRRDSFVLHVAAGETYLGGCAPCASILAILLGCEIEVQKSQDTGRRTVEVEKRRAPEKIPQDVGGVVSTLV